MTLLQTACFRLHEALQLLEEHLVEFPKDEIAKHWIEDLSDAIDELEAGL